MPSFILLITACGDQTLHNVQDFKPNRAPVIIKFISAHEAGDITPGLIVSLDLEAQDPEGDPLTVEFSSPRGSFRSMARNTPGASADFTVGNISGGDEVIVYARVTDNRGASVSASLEIGKSRIGPILTSTHEVTPVIKGNECTAVSFISDSDGYYQVKLLDDINEAAALDPNGTFFILKKGAGVELNICGPNYSGPLAINGIPRLRPVSSTPDKVAIIARDSMNQTGVLEYIIRVSGSSPAPGNSGNITITSLRNESATLAWEMAVDVESPQQALEYLVYYSEESAMDTPEDMDRAGTPFGNWTANINSREVINLIPGKGYYFNVMVRDVDGNRSAYRKINSAMPTDTPPIPGNSGKISTANIISKSLTVIWSEAVDDITVSGDIEYSLYYSLTGNIETVDNTLANGTLLKGWGRYETIHPCSTGSITDGIPYYYNILARDGSGNLSAYSMKQAVIPDATSPIPGDTGLLRAGSITPTGVILNWDKGTDGISGQESLTYKVVYSMLNNIDIVEGAEVFGITVMDWARDINTFEVTGLIDFTEYYFNVLVSDENGNRAAYKSLKFYKPDGAAPVPGNDGVFAITQVTGKSMLVSWTESSDNSNDNSQIQYKIVSSESDNISTVDEAENNGTVAMDWWTGYPAKVIYVNENGKKYFINIIVRDYAGNKSIYQTASATTVRQIYLFATIGKYQGKLGSIDIILRFRIPFETL